MVLPVASVVFQSLTGFPIHLANKLDDAQTVILALSIPDGLPNPFSQKAPDLVTQEWRYFQSLTGFPIHLALGMQAN